jgi:hypothetical protein
MQKNQWHNGSSTHANVHNLNLQALLFKVTMKINVNFTLKPNMDFNSIIKI